MKLRHTDLSIAVGAVWLQGLLAHAPDSRGLILIVQNCSGHHRDSREAHFAHRIEEAGFATLIFDLMSHYEDIRDPDTRFNTPLLGQRISALFEWVRHQPPLAALPLGLVSSGTGSAAAVRALNREPEAVFALLCRGGRPGLAGLAPLRQLLCPTCMISGARDEGLASSRQAFDLLGGPKAWHVVARTDESFREPGTLDEAADLAVAWFKSQLPAPAAAAEPTTEKS